MEFGASYFMTSVFNLTNNILSFHILNELYFWMFFLFLFFSFLVAPCAMISVLIVYNVEYMHLRGNVLFLRMRQL